MKITLFFLYFVASIVLLMLTFRIDEYSRNSILSKASTIASYVILAVLLTFVASFVAPAVTQLLFPGLRGRGVANAMATAGMIFLLFCVISALFGPLGLDIPGTRIRGIFFSEWKFINFVLYNAVLLALLGGVLTRFARN